MNGSDRAPSSKWAPVTHLGEEIAEACFQPVGVGVGEPLQLVFRVPQSRFHVAGRGKQRGRTSI